MTTAAKEDYIVAIKREARATSKPLAVIFYEAGIPPDSISGSPIARVSVSPAQLTALQKFAEFIHIEKPVAHYPV